MTQRSTASTGNLHDCGVSMKRPRDFRTEGAAIIAELAAMTGGAGA